MTEGTLYDGVTARERRVVLTFAPDGLIVDGAPIALSDLRRTSAGDVVQLRRIDAPDWRLRPDAAPQDWPNISSKPVDHPFGPYTDGFSEQQHKYGPFAPIAEVKEKQKRKE